MNDHVRKITDKGTELAAAYERLGVVPASVLEHRADVAYSAYWIAMEDPHTTREARKAAFLEWAAAYFDQVG